MSASLIAMGLSIVFIYMLIAFLFESILMPLSIVLTIPLAAIGSIWVHYLTETEIDDMGIVGGILLIGVVVNNGIVLIDYVNRLRLRHGAHRGPPAGDTPPVPPDRDDSPNDHLRHDPADFFECGDGTQL